MSVDLVVEGVVACVFNTHLIANYKPETYLGYRTSQAQLLQLEDHLRVMEMPIVVCGDLNMTVSHFPDTSYLRTLAEAFDWELGPHTVDNQTNPLRQGNLAKLSGRGRSKPNYRVDYGLWRDLTKKNSNIVFSQPVEEVGYLSDHYGIYLELST
jgi:endonuclease/exonuclease/phosphatase family metal-dependent hydrolase